jgi:hypothetical protein
LADTLRDLTAATAALVESGDGPLRPRGGERFEADFEQEPDIVRVSLERLDDGRARIIVTKLEEGDNRQGDNRRPPREPVMRASRALPGLARRHLLQRAMGTSVVAGTRATVGEARRGREQWHNPLPNTEHERLKNALRVRTKATKEPS